jgi:hypothetical protein
METILRNFEDNLIDKDTFDKLLGRFKKSPADYGYEISISPDGIMTVDVLVKILL